MPTLSALIQREDCPIWSTALAQLMFTTSRAECSELRSQRVLHIRSLFHRLELRNSTTHSTRSVGAPIRSERSKRSMRCSLCVLPPVEENLLKGSFRSLGQLLASRARMRDRVGATLLLLTIVLALVPTPHTLAG